jgi:translation initiation factor IF-1
LAVKTADCFETEGTVVEKVRGGFFRVRVAGTSHVVLTRVANKLNQHHIFITTGDRVLVELPSADLTRGQIVYRFKE